MVLSNLLLLSGELDRELDREGGIEGVAIFFLMSLFFLSSGLSWNSSSQPPTKHVSNACRTFAGRVPNRRAMKLRSYGTRFCMSAANRQKLEKKPLVANDSFVNSGLSRSLTNDLIQVGRLGRFGFCRESKSGTRRNFRNSVRSGMLCAAVG